MGLLGYAYEFTRADLSAFFDDLVYSLYSRLLPMRFYKAAFQRKAGGSEALAAKLAYKIDIKFSNIKACDIFTVKVDNIAVTNTSF